MCLHSVSTICLAKTDRVKVPNLFFQNGVTILYKVGIVILRSWTTNGRCRKDFGKVFLNIHIITIWKSTKSGFRRTI